MALCEACKGIPFHYFAGPTAATIFENRRLQKNGQRFNHSYVDYAGTTPVVEMVSLGSLARIRTSSRSCDLCALFYRAIQNRGALYLNNQKIPQDDNNILVQIPAGMGYYGYVTESTGDGGVNPCPDNLFVLKRIELRLGFAQDTTVDGTSVPTSACLAFYRNVAQPCHIEDYAKGPVTGPSLHMLFSGRRRPDTVDVAWIRRWMHICASEHDLSCEDEDETQDPARFACIRFIDVDQNCLCVLHDVDCHDLRYTALSYVWGAARQVKLDDGNEARLCVPRALNRVRLPQTLADAIHLTRLLGLRYVWIDVLCIRQGQSPRDLDDRKSQIGNMGSIYRHAAVTIVAACGADANAGLCGLFPDTHRPPQHMVPVSPATGLAFVSTCDTAAPWTGFHEGHGPYDGSLDQSCWNTRAWTFQERVLSRRCLVFTPEQVYWVCDGAIFCEESHFEPLPLYTRSLFDLPLRMELFGGWFRPLGVKSVDGPLAQMTTTRLSFWDAYQNAVASYTRRTMTCAGDVHDAFSSILEALTRLAGETFIWGHPRSRLALSLAWTSPAQYYRLRRRMTLTTLPMTERNERVQLPSWSWMGWIGEVLLSVGDQRSESDTAEIVCFQHANNPLRLSRVCGENRFDIPIHDGDKAQPERQYPAWRREPDQTITWPDIQRALPGLTEAVLQTIPQGHILFFWASAAFFSVERPAKPPGNNLEMLQMQAVPLKPRVTNKQGVAVGVLDMLDRTDGEDGSDPLVCYEFIAIGRREIAQLPDTPAVVLALQISWQDGIAFRENMAEIQEDAWMAACPSRTPVALM